MSYWGAAATQKLTEDYSALTLEFFAAWTAQVRFWGPWGGELILPNLVDLITFIRVYYSNSAVACLDSLKPVSPTAEVFTVKCSF